MNFFTWVYVVLFFFGIFFLMIFMFLHYRNRHRLFASPAFTKHYSVSFLVPAYNEQSSLVETVEAIVNMDYPKDKREIIIINDGSKDNTKNIALGLVKKYSNVCLLNKPNSGKANSLNEALKIATGELIAVVDADSYPRKDALLKMIGHFDDSSVGAVTSRVLVKNKPNWLGKFQVMDYSIIAWTRKLLDFVDSVYVTNGPLSMYRKNLVIKLGGFDPKNLTEDIEITWHILSKGYRTRMSYDAIVYTTVPEDFKTWIKQRVRWNLGGLQTVQKYWKAMFREGAFGHFVIPYVTASFIFAIIGFLLFSRYIWIKGSYNLFSWYYSLQGYPFWRYFDYTFSFTLLLFLGICFFALAIWYYKTGFMSSETGNKSVIKIVGYSFFYRSLYVIPLIIALYKLARGDIRWYTK